MADEHDPGVFRRAWESWSNFWFRPADPTPLCLMRIVAGILTIYVHLAYCIDLEAFFGPDGWYPHSLANQTRLHWPHTKSRYEFDRPTEELMFLAEQGQRPEGMAERDIEMPADRRTRTQLKEFIGRLVAAPDAEKAIGFLRDLTVDGERGKEVLRYMRTLSRDPAQRNAALNPFVEDKLTEDEKLLLPGFFARQVTPESRKSFAEAMCRFQDFLPPAPDDSARLINLFLETGPDDWNALITFVYKLKAKKPGERERYLDFLAEWNFSPDLLYTEGMQVVSPWFFVKDRRFLWMIHGLHIFVMLLFTLGMYTRVTSVLTWMAALAYVHRAQPYLFGQDTMMILALFYLMMSPCGAKWSLDRFMARKRAEAEGKPLPPIAPSVSAGFVLRLIQVQYCFMYMSAGLAKLKGNSWWNGTALFNCMANPEFSPMHIGLYRDFLKWMCSDRVIWELINSFAAVFTLVTEIGFPFLVWTRLRPVWLALAILMHMGIAMLMGLSVFSLFMFCLLLCFFRPEAINWMFDADGSSVELAKAGQFR